MKKSLLAVAMIVPIIFTSCGSSQDKLAAIFTDMVCVDQFTAKGIESMRTEGFDTKAYQATRSEMNKALKTEMQAAFAKEADMKTAYAAISDKAAFKKQIADAATAKCAATSTVIDKVFAEVDGDIAK